MLNLTTKELQLYTILNNKSWYSYGVNTIKRKLKVEDIKSIAQTLSAKMNDKAPCGLTPGKINFFTYNDIDYMGFESRRIDYENDKKNGTNKVEKLIQAGAYKTKN